jgi:hypothetical protein
MYNPNRRRLRILNNVEYICLKMQSHPFQSCRFYRRELTRYSQPGAQNNNGDNNSFYFRRDSPYRNTLWLDTATKRVKDHMPWHPSFEKTQLKPAVSRLMLTSAGWEKANTARVKLGLDPIPFPCGGER